MRSEVIRCIECFIKRYLGPFCLPQLSLAPTICFAFAASILRLSVLSPLLTRPQPAPLLPSRKSLPEAFSSCPMSPPFSQSPLLSHPTCPVTQRDRPAGPPQASPSQPSSTTRTSQPLFPPLPSYTPPCPTSPWQPSGTSPSQAASFSPPPPPFNPTLAARHLTLAAIRQATATSRFFFASATSLLPTLDILPPPHLSSH